MFQKYPKPISWGKPNSTKTIIDHYPMCTFHLFFITPKHAQFLRQRDESIQRHDKELRDTTLNKLTYPLLGKIH